VITAAVQRRLGEKVAGTRPLEHEFFTVLPEPREAHLAVEHVEDSAGGVALPEHRGAFRIPDLAGEIADRARERVAKG
jgi:hypothetical protein